MAALLPHFLRARSREPEEVDLESAVGLEHSLLMQEKWASVLGSCAALKASKRVMLEEAPRKGRAPTTATCVVMRTSSTHQRRHDAHICHWTGDPGQRTTAELEYPGRETLRHTSQRSSLITHSQQSRYSKSTNSQTFQFVIL